MSRAIGQGIVAPSNSPSFVEALARSAQRYVDQKFSGPIQSGIYAAANLPDPSRFYGCLIFCPTETGGATMAFSDGTNWRRVQDRAIVS